MERTQTGARNELKPVKKEETPRAPGSAVLKMYDDNYISLPRAIAGERTPIVINNAFGSWRRLAANYTFGNARAYVGTLFPVTTSEAHSVIEKLLNKQFGKLLPTALWLAQRGIYEDGLRRPYVITRVYPRRLRVMPHDAPAYIESRLTSMLNDWRQGLAEARRSDARFMRNIRNNIEFHERELAHFQQPR